MEAGKNQLSGDIVHEASTDEVKGLRREAGDRPVDLAHAANVRKWERD
jgi:hypothetical protein